MGTAPNWGKILYIVCYHCIPFSNDDFIEGVYLIYFISRLYAGYNKG